MRAFFFLALLGTVAASCSLPRSPLPPARDAGMDTPDAPAFDADLDVPPLDADDGGPDTPDAPPPDVPPPMDVPPDVPPPDVPPDVPSLMGCDRFSVLNGYVNCPSGVPSSQCRFFVDPSAPTSCDTLCATVPGSFCYGVSDPMGMMCAGIGGAIAGGCPRSFDPMVCLCANPP
jgi:hypothetical protein